MAETKFKTNIKCSACVSKVTPFLNETVGEDQWQVDLQSPERVLTTDGKASENEVIAALQEAGYTAEKI